VAVAESLTNSVKVFLGNGDGTLQEPSDFGTDSGPGSVTVADFNADGILDLATANYFSGVSVLLGNGDGTFQAAQSFAAGDHPLSATAGDVNGDGALDLVVTDQGSAPSYDGAVSVLLGNGDGSFALSITTAAGSYPVSIVVADFNADGRLDAAAANFHSNNMSVFINDGIWPSLDLPQISITDVTKAEGKRNRTTLFTFTVTLSAAYDQAVTMSYRTVNGTATTGDSDYVARTGTLTFAPGETTKTITIEVKGDNKQEDNERFYLDLFGNSSNSLFTKNRGVGTILNDD
jgi:hypothetical protein